MFVYRGERLKETGYLEEVKQELELTKIMVLNTIEKIKAEREEILVIMELLEKSIDELTKEEKNWLKLFLLDII